MTLWQHLKAISGVVVISTNLIVVLIPLLIMLLLAPLQLFFPSLPPLFHRATFSLYRFAVAVNDAWLNKCIGVTWLGSAVPDGAANEVNLRADRSYLVIANHQSWFDIYVLQSLIVRNGPMLKFLVKRELAFVPIVGWIILALRFPLLHRKRKSEVASKHDIDVIEQACKTIAEHPAALLNFVEGTRFSIAKHEQQASPYRNLLKPRRTGLRSMINSLENDIEGIVDISLHYPGSPSFWQCMGGVHKRIEFSMELLPCPSSSELEQWLDQRWQKKDLFLQQSA